MSTQNTIKHLISASIAAGALLAGAPAAQAVPATITHQGRLYDANKMPVTGVTLKVTFKIYAKIDDTTDIWSETLDVPFDEGYFSATLGEQTPFFPPMAAAIFDGTTRYMGVTVEGDSEMSPRAAVQSVPYAFVARDVNGDIHPTSISVNGTEIINSAGQWVGMQANLVGPTGPQGAPGMNGAQGPKGDQGPVGPTGPAGVNGTNGTNGTNGATGVVSTTTIAGSILVVQSTPVGMTPPWVFTGPTANVTVAAGQRITGSAVAAFGNPSANAVTVSASLCIAPQVAGMPIDPFFASNVDASVLANPLKTMLSASGSIAPAAGSYKVGFCLKNKSTSVNIGPNDYVNGWFIVTN
jgi:Collagen triple helix repeat (20 copies)